MIKTKSRFIAATSIFFLLAAWIPSVETVANTRTAIAWCLKNPRVSTVILGASHVKQLDENLAALNVVESLNKEVMDRIETILDNKPKLPEQF